jgi:AMP-binding enzyme
VILGDPSNTVLLGKESRITLDDMFCRAAARRPDALALVDPPNRNEFTDGAPRLLTYAQADRVTSAIAGRLHDIGLRADAIVGFQLPNTVESVLVLLGILRAGMIAAPLPLLWRRADGIAALTRLGAKALITCRHAGAVDYADLAMQAAAEVFPIRYVCGFGRNLPDGIVPFDDLFARETPAPVAALERAPNPAAHLAVITWDVTADGPVPVARNHHQLLAGGLAVTLETRFARDTIIQSAVPIASFAGLSLAVLPWLLSGGTLCLQQPFEPDAFIAQLRERQCQATILPGPLLPRLAEAGFLHPRNGLRHVLAHWRAPERLAASPQWHEAVPVLIDVQVFGEAAVIAARRDPNGRPTLLPFGLMSAPRGAAGGMLVAEMSRTDAGTLALRGPMIPTAPFPPGAEGGDLPYFKLGSDGMFDTGCTCRIDKDSRTLVVTGPPAGIVSVGGYRFLMNELQDLIARLDGEAALAVLPDTFTGQRLAGMAPDREAVQQALAAAGINPLVVAAFRSRGGGEQAAVA